MDGTVESHAEGSIKKLESFIDWCHQGPPEAAVSLVESNWVLPKGYQEFSIK